MKDSTYELFVKRWEQVLDLPPQRVGVLTPVYKYIVKHLKVMPWPWFLVVSTAIVFGLCVVFGATITRLVSLLQRGF